MYLSLHPRPLGVAILKSVESLARHLGQPLLDFRSLSVQRFLKYASSGPENGPKEAVIPKKGSLGALDGILGRAGIRRDLLIWFASFFWLQCSAVSQENTMHLLFRHGRREELFYCGENDG
jgi:hypothetical protein